MSVSSPGLGASPWSASVAPQELPLEFFLRSGTGNVPVAMVPTDGGIINMKNPKTIQVELQKASTHYRQITEVRQFGKGGILCCSPDHNCAKELLNCPTFASHPVRCFVPPHLACSRGIVRGVDVSLTPEEILEMFSVAGVISVYRCSRVIDNKKTPTESVIITCAGTLRPTEIKVWPLIYKVEALAPRILQCANCWRFGHNVRGCRSAPRCRNCGDNHNFTDCSSEEEKCCLCSGGHPANYSNCPARTQELQILEVIERRRCSRRDAVAEVQGRSKGYAGVTARQQMVADSTLSDAIAIAVEKALSKAMERLTSNLSETLAHVMTSQMIQLFSSVTSPNTSSQIPTNPITSNAGHLIDPSPVIAESTKNARPSTSTQQTDNGCFSGSVSENNQDVEMDLPTLKRTRSPNDNSSTSVPHSKTKKNC